MIPSASLLPYAKCHKSFSKFLLIADFFLSLLLIGFFMISSYLAACLIVIVIAVLILLFFHKYSFSLNILSSKK
jgi:hypothetical protein